MDFAALQHSVFLQALGSAILNSLWQCFILWLVYETISVAYKSASARFKNNLGTLLLFFSFAWFLTSFISKIFNAQNVTSVATIPAGFALEPQHGVHSVSGFSTLLSYASASLPYLSVAYIFLLFFLIAKLFAAYRYVYFISNKRLVNPTVELQLFAYKVAREIGITKKINVWISHHIDVPATIGFIKPVILIPVASINNLSCHQLEAIILHELAHIKRNDYITNLIISVIETTLFFNPFVVLLSNVIKRERENCCDDFVLQYRYDPHSYASALLRLEQSRMSKLKLAIGAVSGKKQLLSRIKRITSNHVVSRQFNYGQKVIALLLVTAFICSVAWLSPEEKKSVSAKALARPGNPPVVQKAKSPVKGRMVEAIITGKQNGALPLQGIKHASPKNNEATLAETDIENTPPDNNSVDEDANENKENNDNQDLFKIEGNPDYSQARAPINAAPPRFFINGDKIKLPKLATIQNFLFQNMNINIDLSKIDMGKMNENLDLAYKQINALDWNRIQNEIRMSFPKVKDANFSKKDQDALLFYAEKAKTKALNGFNLLRKQQRNDPKADPKALLERVKDQIYKEVLLDSLRSAQVTVWNDNAAKVQEAYKKVEEQYGANTMTNYFYNYSNNTGGGNSDDDEVTPPCPKKNNAHPNSWKKTIRISIRRVPGNTRIVSDKKPLQFSFIGNSNDEEKPTPESVISVQVND